MLPPWDSASWKLSLLRYPERPLERKEPPLLAFLEGWLTEPASAIDPQSEMGRQRDGPHNEIFSISHGQDNNVKCAVLSLISVHFKATVIIVEALIILNTCHKYTASCSPRDSGTC